MNPRYTCVHCDTLATKPEAICARYCTRCRRYEVDPFQKNRRTIDLRHIVAFGSALVILATFEPRRSDIMATDGMGKMSLPTAASAPPTVGRTTSATTFSITSTPTTSLWTIQEQQR